MGKYLFGYPKNIWNKIYGKNIWDNIFLVIQKLSLGGAIYAQHHINNIICMLSTQYYMHIIKGVILDEYRHS